MRAFVVAPADMHPDAVFDTGLWSGGVLEARAAHYGMSVEDYKTRNLLRTEICSRDVAELAAALCVDVPVTREVYAIVHQNKSTQDAVHALLERDLKPEQL